MKHSGEAHIDFADLIVQKGDCLVIIRVAMVIPYFIVQTAHLLLLLLLMLMSRGNDLYVRWLIWIRIVVPLLATIADVVAIG